MATDCLDKIPIQLKEPIESGDRYISVINIPCGKCARCLERRKMEWAFRMEKEMEVSKTAYFVTLTYNPENVPYNKYGQKTLIPTREIDLKIRLQEEGKKRITKKFKHERPDRSLQGFFKRLRTYQSRGPYTFEHLYNGLKNSDEIKYYAAGEYGETRGRPHYHAIIFNASRTGILSAWQYGDVHIVPANKNTIAYVMKYLDKQLNNEKTWKAEKEFNTMSEGIGLNYIQKNQGWHRANLEVLYVTNMQGIRIPMPKYYRLKIFNEEERKEQIMIVTQVLDDNRNELITDIGQEMYNYIQPEIKKESERRFKKKIKKRIVD